MTAPSPLPSILALDRIWWVKDPVPDWMRVHLDKGLQIELAKIDMQLQTSILQAQLDATKRSLELLGRAK